MKEFVKAGIGRDFEYLTKDHWHEICKEVFIEGRSTTELNVNEFKRYLDECIDLLCCPEIGGCFVDENKELYLEAMEAYYGL